MKKRVLFSSCIAFVLLIMICMVGVASAVDIPRFELVRIGTLGGAESMAYGVNDSGQVVGWSRDSSNAQKAFIWSNGILTPLVGTSANALEINNLGQIAGEANDRAVIWQNGLIIDLGTTGIYSEPAIAINDAGQVTGWQHTSATDASSPYHAWIWDSTSGIQDIDTTGNSWAYDINELGTVVGRIGSPVHQGAIWENGSMTPIANTEQAQGINDLGQVVGYSSSHSAFLYNNGTIIDLGKIGDSTDAKAINNRTQIVGKYMINGSERALLWSDGVMYELNDLVTNSSGFLISYAADINNSGQIVGWGIIDGNREAYLLNPIIRITIDIQPADTVNEINLKRMKTVSVAVLSSTDFSAPSDVDQTSLTFGVTGDEASLKSCARKAKDINKDGFIDLSCTFSTNLARFQCGDTEGILKGKTVAGISFEGIQSVSITPCR